MRGAHELASGLATQEKAENQRTLEGLSRCCMQSQSVLRYADIDIYIYIYIWVLM